MGRWFPPLCGIVPPTKYQQRCVMFVCAEREGEIRPTGTAFLVGVRDGQGGWVRYFVTAKHVVEHGQPTYIRLRRADNGPPEDKALDEWVPHPMADVAATPCALALDEYVSSFEPVEPQHTYRYAPTVGQRAHFVGLLGDVPTMAKRAVPMMRSASIGALYVDEIPVAHESAGMHYEPQAHLIDTYSRSGFSGSPVYADYTFTRQRVTGPAFSSEEVEVEEWSQSALLGVLTGHFGLGDRNTGVAIVVPMEALQELLADPRLVEFHQREAARMAKRRKDEEVENAAVLDSLEQPAPSDERVSLDGIDPEDALRALLRTPPSGRTQDPA